MLSFLNTAVCVAFLFPAVSAELDRHLRVSEAVPIGYQIGYVTDNLPTTLDQANYYVVFPETESTAEKVLNVNEKTGEITVQGELDYEKEAKLTFLAIPTSGETTIKVVIDIIDENDNAPTFPISEINLEISEYARIDTELVLPSAVDLDSDMYTVKKYATVGGNVNNVFRLSTSKLNNALYVDLVVNGQLDREYRDRYDLVIEATDGGDPPKTGRLTVHVLVLDANDNAPEFSQSRYSAHIQSNATVGTVVTQVKAHDADAGDNAKISYKLANSQFNNHELIPFKIDSETGEVTVSSNRLSPGTNYELVVIASDHGAPQALESTVFLTIHVQSNAAAGSINDLNIVWLTEDGSATVLESLPLGFVLARVSVRAETDEELSLHGTSSLCIKQTDSPTVYLVLICGPLDRETIAEMHLKFVLKSGENVILDHPLIVHVVDVNDNAPQWNRTEYRITLNRNNEGRFRSVYRFLATDDDFGENARIHYSLQDTDLFSIDSETGVLIVQKEIDCFTADDINFVVIATDNGKPSLSSNCTVVVDVIDSDAEPPSFEKSLYEVTIKEDADISTCLIQVSAKDNSCGKNSSNKMRYSFKEMTRGNSAFKIDAQTGKICLRKSLDYEETSRYQLSVHATDSGGKVGSTLINVLVDDINDNAPVFEPENYNVTIYGDLPVGTALLSVQAVDADMGQFGEVRYDLVDENTFFHIDSRSGRIYSDKPIYPIVNKSVDLKIMAKDSGGLSSSVPANVRVTVLPTEQDCPHFSRGLYEFTISEDILPGIVIGNVEAVSHRLVTYKIVSGNNGRFQLDAKTGKLTVAKEQDADKMDVVLLNVEARATDNCASFSQIRIRIHDVNDNAPQFDMNKVETSVAENFSIHEPFFAVQAIDRDKHENGKVTYELIKSVPVCPVIVRPLTGQLLLAASLDYEKGNRYTLTIRAQDQGIPPKSSLTTVILNVLDVNDNTPEFENQLYNLEIAEDAPLMTPLTIIKATDKDSGDNGAVRYKIADDSVKHFGINYNSGELFVRQSLDRETISEYSFLVIAQDKGNPTLTSNVSVHIRILDVNDNTPDCTSIRSLRVSEDMSPHEVIGRIDARDRDAGLNGTVVYRMQQTNDLFDIKQTGEITLRKRIRSGDIRSPFQFGIIAEDRGLKPRPAVCLVTIDLDRTVSDVQLTEPIERTIHLNSDDTVGSILLVINATNAVEWTLEQSGVYEYFGIDNGSVFLAHSPGERRFSKPQPLTVLISDAQSRRKQATFIVRFHHVSTPDNETIVTKIRETSTIGTKLLTLATNEESSDSEYYSLRKTSPYFEFDEHSGTVYLAKMLDYNDAATLHIEVEKRSLHHYRKKDMTLVFELDDANNHSPKFHVQNYTFSLTESTPVGSLIGQVETFDDDDGPNGVVKYRFRNSEDTFSINVETGEIFLQKPLHHHVNPTYYLVVEAEDSAPAKGNRRRSQCPVFIDVIDTNDNSPFFRSADNTSVLLSVAFNYTHPIHYFVATDDDAGLFGTLKYRIISGNEQQQFVLNATSGALFLKSKLESTTKLTIRASDISTSPRFTDHYFTIFVDHVSADWTYFEKEAFNLKLIPYSVEGTVAHNFSKKGARGITYNLLPKDQKTFKIGSQDGVLRAAGTLNPGVYRFIVYAMSTEANATDYASVVVNVRQEKTTGPKIVQESCGNVTVIENQATVNMLRIFTIKEVNDTESVVFYHIEGGAENLFSINETSGMVSCQSLDREHKSEHFLIISASDNSVPKRADVCTVRVLVKDENDNVPKFLPSMLQVVEINDSMHVSSLVMKVTATDADEGDNGRVKYRIKSDPSGTLDIDPDTGELIFARDYPFDKAEFMLYVVAEDCGASNVQRSEQKIRVLWNRATKGFLRGEPKFLQEKYVAFVMEGLPKGTPVMTIETSNRMFHDGHIQMSIVEGNFDSAFEIDNNGQLKTAEELDAEIRSIYTLKVLGTGKFTGTPETLVEVRVLNANDNAPSVPLLPSITVSEDLPLGSHIATVSANDVDADTILEFNLIGGNDLFFIDRFDGKIFLQAPLDYETQKSVSLDILVFDGVHTVETNFTIIILDVNDNAPQFASQMLKINVAKSASKNDIVGQVVATDLDEGPNGEVRYELLDNANFRIDSKTGQLRLKAPLMPDAVYFVAVKATDRGNKKMSTISTIKIQMVANITEQTAQFERQDYKFLVAENFPHHLPFGRLQLKDASILSTNDVAFNILDAEMARLFDVSRLGEISVIANGLKPTEYSMTVELIIRQNGIPSKKSGNSQKTVVTVVITDINDNTPIFVPETLRLIRVDEQMRKGTILGRLLANDADIGDNGRVQYSMLCGDELNILRVDAHSGAVIYDHWDDLHLFEGSGSNVFNITFLAVDSGSPSRWSVHSVQLELYVDNWSGSAPMFAVPMYRKYVSEAATIGSVILKAQGHNKWDRIGLHWQYSISDNDEIFGINTVTGEVFLNGQLDYERKTSYEFTVTCQDLRHRSAIIPVEINVVGTDEFAPIFSKSSYTFEIPMSAEVGQRIGKVFATDDDNGLDGHVVYSIPDEQGFPFIGIDPDTGIIVLRNALPPNHTIEQFTIIASSGLTQHSRATVFLEMESAATASRPTLFRSSTLNKLTIIVGLVLLVLLLILAFVVCRIYCKTKQAKKPQKQIYSVARGNIAVMADINRASPTFGKIVPSVSYDHAKTFSIMSSNSSERNSNLLRSTYTENLGVRSQPDSGIDPDAISISSSVTDYLIQIGVTPTKLDTNQLNQLSMMTKSATHTDRFDHELNELIYAKVDDLLAPGARLSSSAFESSPYTVEAMLPFGMDTRPRDHHTGPTFQPLTEVFSQISRMKNQQAS